MNKGYFKVRLSKKAHLTMYICGDDGSDAAEKAEEKANLLDEDEFDYTDEWEVIEIEDVDPKYFYEDTEY